MSPVGFEPTHRYDPVADFKSAASAVPPRAQIGDSTSETVILAAAGGRRGPPGACQRPQVRTVRPCRRILCPRMPRTSSHRLISILCLLAFGLGQTLFAFLGVRCTDATGRTRIELACIKSSQGRCLALCDILVADSVQDEHGSDQCDTPLPCEDEPLGPNVVAARSAASSASVDSVLLNKTAVALRTARAPGPPEPTRRCWTESGRERPPDKLAHIRTVILLV